MAQNITLWGASYSAVPSVLLPKTGGGTAQFDDTTIAANEAAAASDIVSGKLAWVNGALLVGTGSGGGGTGGVTQDQDGFIVLDDQGGGTAITPLNVTQNGTYTALSGQAYSPVTVNVSGGGSSFELVRSVEETISYTSTSSATIKTLTIPYDTITPDCTYLVCIRDKNGKRAGYFYGSDNYLYIPTTFTTTQYSGSVAKNMYKCNDYDGTAYLAYGNSGYGVTVGAVTIYPSNNVCSFTIVGRYSSSISTTINGIFSINIYKMTYPTGEGL